VIILLGGEGSGKTTLADKLASVGYAKYHFTKDSQYKDYLEPLSKLDFMHAVMDRFIYCEYPYHICMNRPFKYSLKEFHNVILLSLAYNPLIILMTHIPKAEEYATDQYLPYNKLQQCIQLYKIFLKGNNIPFVEIDYGLNVPDIDWIIKEERKLCSEIDWWIPMWKLGYGMVGSHHPKVVLVAERLGNYNVNEIPFQEGPTAYMLSDVLDMSSTPLGSIAITNLIKAKRGSVRAVNDSDLKFLELELIHLKPERVICMGSVAKGAIVVTQKLGIETRQIVHLGHLNYQGVHDLAPYARQWKNAFEGNVTLQITPKGVNVNIKDKIL